MKILVTGGAGFIGSHLTKRLLSEGYSVACVDNFNDYYDSKIKIANVGQFKGHKRLSLYKADICYIKELKKIFKKETPEKVCHLAAAVGVRSSIENPHFYIRNNIKGSMNILDLSVKRGVNNFIFASSSAVYGNNKKIPFSEKDGADNPISPYGATKKAGELLAYTYHQLYNLNCTILRFFTVYGPAGRPDMAPFLFTDAVHRGKPIMKFGKGNTKRDYTYIDDIVDGIIASLKNNFSYEIINLGNNKPVELNYLISLIERLLKKKANILQLEKQVGDVDITYADISKAKKLLGYKPKITIEEGMEKFIQWYLRKNES